jgi:outer membrane autotransporter protein
VIDQGWLTPYAGLSYSAGRLKSFTEDGGNTGAALTVSGDGESFVSDIGVRAGYDYEIDDTTTVGATLRLGWQREHGDNPHSFDAAFDGIADSGFTVVGSEQAKDSLALDAGVSVTITDEFELGASYSGRYNTDVTNHSVSATGRLRF